MSFVGDLSLCIIGISTKCTRNILRRKDPRCDLDLFWISGRSGTGKIRYSLTGRKLLDCCNKMLGVFSKELFAHAGQTHITINTVSTSTLLY